MLMHRISRALWRTQQPRAARACFAVSIAVVAVHAAPAAAQQSGRVVGRVVDAGTGAGIVGAQVQVVGTALGAVAGVDGRFTILNVPASTFSLQARRIGYQPKAVTGLQLAAGQAVEQNISLSAATVQLDVVSVTASAERGSTREALDRQRTADNVVNSITSEQIAKSPDSDASQAVGRVSGVTVQEGRFVFVRGLGERYTTTSLNGARLPSPEPERRVVPLDMFPTALLQSVTTSKTFTPDQAGDFSGAQVDLRTREFPARRQVQYSSSIGYNAAATGQSVFTAPGTGREWLGFGGSARALPAAAARAGTFDPAPPQSEINQIVGGFRNAWSPRSGQGTPNTSLGVSVGGNDELLGRRIGYVGSASYSYAQEVRENEVRAYAEPTGGTREVDRFEGTTGRNTVLWGGLANLSTLFGTGTRISFNNTYNRTADDEARRETGFSENLGQQLFVDRLRFIERTVRSNQLAGEHQLGERHRIDWSLTSSGVSRKEPDRSEFVQASTGEPGAAPFWLDASESAVRTFGELSESNLSSSADYTLQFGGAERQHRIKTGGLVRYTDRAAENLVFSIQSSALSLEERRLAPEQLFGGQFTEPGDANFRVVPLGQGGSYDAREFVSAGYAMTDYALSDRLRFVGGARVEFSSTEVKALPTVGRAVRTTPEYLDVLPSAALNYQLTGQQNLRLSASQTLSRPEYRELAQVQYRDVIGAENVLGNPGLKRTLIQNADVRWEWYPNAGEVLSVGAFYKRFDNPIERVFLATSGTRIVTFLNAEGADNVGLELEARKGLGFLAPALEPFSVSSNVTVMRSEIRLSDTTRAVDESRAMVGQAPYVVNAGLTYAPGSSGRLSATLLYNRVGRRIVSASQFPLPVTYEQPRDVIDLSLRFPILAGVSGRFDARNLADAAYNQTQGSVTREYYRAGRVFQLGLTWAP
jgi:TonB-dependent receptor